MNDPKLSHPEGLLQREGHGLEWEITPRKPGGLVSAEHEPLYSCDRSSWIVREKEAVRTDRGYDGATRPKVAEQLPKTLDKMKLVG